MTGSAYRTVIRPSTELGPFVTGAAVFALYPPVPFDSGIPYDAGVTSYVIVSAVPWSNDTHIFPCTEEGVLLSWLPLESVGGLDHSRALRVAGYEVEEVSRGVA